MRSGTRFAAAVFVWFAALPAGAEVLRQTAREIPVAYDVDVVVVGGGTGAVSAAVAAAGEGARVFLAAPHPYLGDDMTATLQLWLEEGEQPASPLARAVYQDAVAEAGSPPRPLHIKQTLEQTLLDAGVMFLFSCYATDVLCDAAGKPAGIVMANRAGRQAVVARTIVDATERGVVARWAGARFRSYPAGRHVFRRVVIGGEPVESPQSAARVIGNIRQSGRTFPLIEYTLELEMADGSIAAFAQADQAARTITYHPAQQMTSDRLFQVPPDAMHGRLSVDADDAPIDSLPLDAFRPARVDRLYVLGGAADVPRSLAARLMRPVQAIELGRRIGRAAAAEAKSAGALAGVHVPGEPAADNVVEGEVRELLIGVRPTQQLPAVAQRAGRLPVLGSYDVVVVGGGTGGAPAGIAAAREGANTLVLEFHYLLGGVGTAGQITGYYHGHRVGFTATVPGNPRWAPEQKAEWWRRELLDVGGQVWFGAIGCGAVVREGRVIGVVVATPHGRGVILADVAIDATGNSDIAAPAGAETDYTGRGEFAAMGAGTTFRRLGGNGPNPSFTLVDETDLADVWHVLVWSKQKYPEAFDQASLIDTRERRRIVGEFRMTVLDQIVGRTYPDTICQTYSDFDSHGFTIDPFLMLATPPRGHYYLVNIPYRCLLPKGLEGILATGLGISLHRDAIPLVRMQACIQNQGYAAGLAAAMASRNATALRSIDVRALQRQLVAIGNLPEDVLEHEDSLPMSTEAVARAVRDVPPLRNLYAGGDRRVEEIARRFTVYPSQEEFRAAAVIFQHPEIALPMLRQAYESAAGETRFARAQMLAMLGDDSGAELLVERIRAAREWDIGWKYTSMSNFGSAYSPLDTAILALSRTGHPDALPAILDKVALLDAATEFSHHRSVALALERLGHSAAAPALAQLLAKPGMSGYAQSTLAAVREQTEPDGRDLIAVRTRNDSLRELLLARALFRLGDHDGVGERILTAYAADLRGHLARHASAVLADRFR